MAALARLQPHLPFAVAVPLGGLQAEFLRAILPPSVEGSLAEPVPLGLRLKLLREHSRPRRLQEFQEPDSKAAIIWIIGEYAEKINDAEVLIENFLETFIEDSNKVKLQLLTATVKLYLKKPDEAEEIIQKVLKLAT